MLSHRVFRAQRPGQSKIFYASIIRKLAQEYLETLFSKKKKYIEKTEPTGCIHVKNIYYVINFALLEKASKILLFAEEALQKNYLVLSFH